MQRPKYQPSDDLARKALYVGRNITTITGPIKGGHAGIPAPVGTGKPLTGRNEPCPCGSGKKYKACHLREVKRVADQSAPL